jgi:hypothetical protein
MKLSENGIHFYAGMTIREFIGCPRFVRTTAYTHCRSRPDRESNEPLLVKNRSAKVDRKSPEYSDNLPVKT